MKILPLFLLVGLLVGMFMAVGGCGRDELPILNSSQPLLKGKITNSENWICEFNLEGCQYITYDFRGVSHKGNCSNSIHIYNK